MARGQGGRLDFSNPPGAIPADWDGTGHAPAGAFMQWYGGSHTTQKTPQERPQRAGKRNAESGTCPILGHRFRSLMERRFGLWLLFNGYRRWTDKTTDPPADGKWYAYERRDWEFPGIKCANYHYTADYECWPGLPDPDRPGATPLPYVVYEVKGWMDANSNTKLKRMAKFYSDVPVIVVDQPVFDMMTHGAALVVPGWNDRPGRKEGA